MDQRVSTWVGWDPSGQAPERVAGLGSTLNSVRLSRRLVNDYYHGFANRTLWPLLHGSIEHPVFERRWWDAYVAANELFAASDHGGAGIRWVHDYQLMLLPSLLKRQNRPGPIGFFLHVPFPPAETFARLPWRRALLEGVLGADLVSFHTTEYQDNFLRTCRRLLDDVVVERAAVRLRDGRLVRVRVNPISIDAGGVGEAARARPVDRSLERLRRQLAGRRVVLGVDRLDYTKGILERLRSLELLLEIAPHRRSELVYVQVAVPSRGEIREYKELRSAVEGLVGRINGRFTEDGLVPVHYLYRGVSRDQLLAYYRLADTCLVTPLKDGMNLVAKEFVTAQAATDGRGVLVLSEFAGAIEELHEALPCNPFDVEGLAGTLDLALELPADDRRRRIRAMSERVSRHDVFRWADVELGRLAGSLRAAA